MAMTAETFVKEIEGMTVLELNNLVKALEENVTAFIRAVQRAKPAAAKGKYFRTVSVSSTMGPGIRLDTSSLEALQTAGERA